MIEVFSVSFSGFFDTDVPTIELIKTVNDCRTGYTVRTCAIGLPEQSLTSAFTAVSCANILVEKFIEMRSVKLAGNPVPINIVGVSESCGVIRFILNSTIDISINAVLVSACFDRARTPFGGPFSISTSISPESPLRPTPSWFDWRSARVDNRHHLLVCHGTQDLNPSTPFIDAWGFFLRTASEQKDVTLIQVGGLSHGYECLSADGVHDRVMKWIVERDKS